MDALRLRLEEDLRGQIAGEVHCDDLFVQMYASDASIFEVPPLGVVRPRTRDDVVAVVRYAAEQKIPLFPRGSGSGLAGEALGRGLVVDFSRYFRRILAITDEAVVVQPGVVVAQLNDRLAPTGRVFGPDPAASQVRTLGSMIAVNGSGSHWPAYGSTRRHVRELEVVLADGTVARLTRSHFVGEPPRSGDAVAGVANGDPARRLAVGVNDILDRHAAAIAGRTVRSLEDRSGYRLHDIRTKDSIDLARLIVGSEGTLAMVTQATIETSPLPRHVGSVLLFFTSVDAAARAAVELASRPLRACDLMDRRHLSIAREMDLRYELLIPPEAEAVLLVEREGETLAALDDSLREIEDLIVTERNLASAAHRASDPYDHDLAWQLARRFSRTLNRLRGNSRPAPFVEDVAVPPADLPEFLQAAHEALRSRQITASIFAHAAHGQVHIRPFVDLADGNDMAKLQDLAAELYEHVWKLHGTISGEHAEGLSRTPFVARQHGPMMAAFREVKALFDPQNLLNPGKKIPAEDGSSESVLRRFSYPLIDRLGDVPTPPTSPAAGETGEMPLGESQKPLPLQLAWRRPEMSDAARMCNGCGVCRTQESDTRMCPIFRYSPREEASPRAKANLARGILTGSLPPGIVTEDACKEIADLCVHCHMCRLECPANVDIPKLMAEAKADYVAVNGQTIDDWTLSHIDEVCRRASRFARVVNWGMSNRSVRWVLEKTLGIAQGRKLPRLNRRPFLDSQTQRRLSRHRRGAGEKVLLFVDTFANYCDAQLAEALVRVLEHNGIAVYVPDRQREAGMPLFAAGAVGPLRRVAEQNVALLAEAVRQGYTIVSTEPSAILALTREYGHLLGDDPDVRLVAEHSMEACHYLWRWHQRGKLQLNFHPVEMTVAYHAPCHVKALEVGLPSLNLLGLVPGLRVRHIERGCSGMAGMYGFNKKNYRTSLRVGLPLISALRTGGYQAGVTECSTCRVQMEQGTTMPTVHPVKLLALAYGLMPELRAALDSPTEELVVK